MEMHCMRAGEGRPLLLLHGLGGSWRSWCTVLPALRRERDVIAVDLPGFGDTPSLGGPTSIRTLADAVTEFLGAHALFGVDVAGVSSGGLLALELAGRGAVGSTVALCPPGFWTGWQKMYFGRSAALLGTVARKFPLGIPLIAESRLLKTLLLQQLSPKPWALPKRALEDEIRDLERARRTQELLRSLVAGPEQEGAPAGSLRGQLTLGWGRQDRLCLPSQAERAKAMFPGARLHWFRECGHFPQWDQPKETAELILESTSPGR